MTTYTTIPNSEVDQDSPVTQPLMTALRDNPIAITEGASGAPKIQTAAIQDLAVTTAKLGNSSVTAAKIAAGNVINASIGSGAVTRVKITTSTASASGSISSGGGDVAIGVSAYSFFPTITATSTAGSGVDVIASTGGSADAPQFILRNGTGTTITYTVAWRYISA